MSLKTTDCHRFSIVYDDEEKDSGHVAELYSWDGKHIGGWDNKLEFYLAQPLIELTVLAELSVFLTTSLVSNLRQCAGFDQEITVRTDSDGSVHTLWESGNGDGNARIDFSL